MADSLIVRLENILFLPGNRIFQDKLPIILGCDYFYAVSVCIKTGVLFFIPSLNPPQLDRNIQHIHKTYFRILYFRPGA